eukprot:TRINITY_DN2405_c0_g2_i5.p1 TRINITY_DN2405_c0_g2~~TRINITY_DN2405_c0_g2_i5.p1  ORF type:complete len:305 (+),score=71.47 TRINITY_DN2405_c0_g2_i5:652-1566(+)
MGHCLEEAVKLVKDFARSYIYIKGYERDYGNRLKELCRKVEMKFSDMTAPLSITSREERSYFSQKLSESLVFSLIHDNLKTTLQKAFTKEEKALNKIILNLELNNDFDPVQYGQDATLLDCNFTKTVLQLKALDGCTTVFERVDHLRQTSKTLLHDITEHWYYSNVPATSVTPAIITASLMSVLLKARLANPLLHSLLLKYFVCVDYNLLEIRTVIKNFIYAVKGLSKMGLKDTSGVIECDSMLSIKDLILKDFFVARKRKVLSRIEQSFHKPVVAYTKQYEDYFLPEDMSDAETDEIASSSHK